MGMDCRARGVAEAAAPVLRDFGNPNLTWQEALLGFERLFAPPDAVANACENMEAIKHRPWNGELICTAANLIEKERGRAQGEHATDRARQKILLEAVELCSKLLLEALELCSKLLLEALELCSKLYPVVASCAQSYTQ